ncbi:MAG: hypothetical protein JJU21_12170 [Salinarimonas sp.]|nr:hypothetical protein [Salinarimonas sp.]
MTNILSTAATDAAFLTIPSDNNKLTATIVQGSGFTQLDQQHQLKCPGIYIAVSPEGGIYVGVAANLLARTNRFTATPTPPAMLVFITGNTALLPQESALVIERIVFQAFRTAGLKMFNRYEPLGAPLALDEYASLQGDWAAMISALAPIVPGLACPWLDPGHTRMPPPETTDAYHEERLVAQKRGIRAVVKRISRGYVIQAGSRVRAEPIRSAGNLCMMMRIEARYAGLLVPDGEHLRLTRPVFRRTLCSCSRFVYTTGETSIWQRPDDQFPSVAA